MSTHTPTAPAAADHTAAALAELSRLPQDAFVARLDGIFEHSPWIAERAWSAGPFASIDALHAAMCLVVDTADATEQLALICAHPELAGKEAEAGTMTNDSVSEQASAGLDALTRDEMLRMRELNARYRARHGFPFIIAVRRHTKASIFSEFSRRLDNDSETELQECLAQIFVITRLRLHALAGETAPV